MKLLVLLICSYSSILKETVALEIGEVSSRISRTIYSPEDFLELFKYSAGFAWDHYPSFDEINDFIEYLGETYSDFVTVYLAGCSGEGRPIKVVHVKSGNCSANRIWIDGGIHGREWVTPSAVLLILFQLVERRESNSEAIRGVDFFACPIINPDGYEYSRQFSNYWRKNRRKTEIGCVGVDLNRNWIYQPEHSNTSGESCQELYPGPRPFSEPETQAIKSFLDQNRVNLKLRLDLNTSMWNLSELQIFEPVDLLIEVKAFLTFHTYGQMIMYPYGYKAELPEDHDDLQRLATHIVQNISYHGGPQYKVVNTYNHSGFSVGGLDDYAKEVLGIKYTYTVELRDTGTYIFFLPRRLILPTSIDAVVVAMTVAEHVSRM